PVAYSQNQPAAGLDPLGKAVAVGKEPVPRAHLDPSAIAHVPGDQTVKILVLLNAVRADVLDRCRTGGAGNQSKVLQPCPALLYAGGNEMVPRFSGLHLDNARLGVVVDQFDTAGFDMNDQTVDMRCEHHVASATQNHHARIPGGSV